MSCMLFYPFFFFFSFFSSGGGVIPHIHKSLINKGKKGGKAVKGAAAVPAVTGGKRGGGKVGGDAE